MLWRGECCQRLFSGWLGVALEFFGHLLPSGSLSSGSRLLSGLSSGFLLSSGMSSGSLLAMGGMGKSSFTRVSCCSSVNRLTMGVCFCCRFLYQFEHFS